MNEHAPTLENEGDQSARTVRCAFVHAPDSFYADTQNYGAKFMPLWAYTLAAHVPQNDHYKCRLYDTRCDNLTDVECADIFLFSGINQDYGHLLKVQKDLKSRYPEAVHILGGPIAWSFDQAGDLDRLSDFDHIFIGDGEAVITDLLEAIRTGQTLEKVIHAPERFPMADSISVGGTLLEGTIANYYGAVIEVSRGCPFLCEFCDIRILPDNNRAHNKPVSTIIEEIDRLSSLGVSQILLACDNFIGDPRWAEDVVDALIAWQERTDKQLALYTWLTVNLFRHPRLMQKMRRAGFDMLFIGIESFSANSLLETAKLQNPPERLTQVIRDIQSYGFIVVAGLIFGFDSDGDDCFSETLEGLRESGLLSGDPSLLTALPGTPLYRRMRLTGRLRDVRYGLGGFKYQTNIKYLMDRDTLIRGHKCFVSGFNSGLYQFDRLRTFFEVLNSGNFVPLPRRGYGSLSLFLRMLLGNRRAITQLVERAFRFATTPANLYYAILGLLFVLTQRRIKGRLSYYQFWLFAWSNSILKYKNIRDEDFDIESLGRTAIATDILPRDYVTTATEEIPREKINAQTRATISQLNQLISELEPESETTRPG